MSSGFWWILAGMGIYGIIHSLLAGEGAKALAERWFGPAGRRWYRLFFNIQGALTFLPVLVLVRLLPDTPIYRIPMPLTLLTMALQASALLAMLVTLHETGIMAFAGFAPEAEGIPAHLVTEGFYRYMRHPLYTLGLVVVWLLPTMTWNTLALDIGITAYILVGVYFEERKLRRQFGADYETYRKQTPMLFPLPSRLPPIPKITL